MSQGIYKIMNIVSNKFYVGSAVDLKRRRARHFSELRTGRHKNRHLQAAWNKYGETAFIFVVVEEVPAGSDLLAAEDRWLQDCVGKEHCYNIGVTALAPMLGKSGESSPTWGYKHTDDAKQKISATSKVRVQTDEEKQKRRVTMRGRPQPAAVRAKISATLSGAGNFWYGKQRPEHGEKVSRPVRAISPTETTTYPSITAMREALGLKPPTVNRALQSGKLLTKGPFKDWRFEYAGE